MAENICSILPKRTTDVADQQPPWRDLLVRIQQGDQCAAATLYSTLSNGIRAILKRSIDSDDVEDALHDVFVALLESIRSGRIRQPDRLPGYVRTIVRRTVSHRLRSNYATRRCHTLTTTCVEHNPRMLPEAQYLRHEYEKLAVEALSKLPLKWREIIYRAYFLGQTNEQIRAEMNLTENQLRMHKHRAKELLVTLVRRRAAAADRLALKQRAIAAGRG